MQIEVIKTVLEHLASMTEQSAYGSQCMYRGPNGNKCAAGILISDEEYTDSMELANVYTLVKRFPSIRLARFDKDTLSEISHLQQLHDRVDAWEKDEEGIQYGIKPVLLAKHRIYLEKKYGFS